MSLSSSVELPINPTMGQTESDLKSTCEAAEDAGSTIESDRNESEGSTSSQKVMEWNFIDFSKADRCPIFDVDTVMLKKFVGHNVTVYNTSREVFHGCCLAIDPVSLSVILARRVPEGKIRIITLPGYHLAKICVNPDSVPSEAQVSVNDLDVAELYHAPSLLAGGAEKKAEPESSKLESQPNNAEDLRETKSGTTTHPTVSSSDGSDRTLALSNNSNEIETSAQTYSEYDANRRKENFKELLTKHRLPFTDNNGILELPGGVTITFPYTLESCDTKGNKLIRKKLGELMKSLE